MECYICSTETSGTFLCEDCCSKGLDYLRNKVNIIKNPDWRYHCLLCGEYDDRIIVNFSSGPVCDQCILGELEKYKINKSNFNKYKVEETIDLSKET